jgi:hypothetical protein
MTVSSAGPPGEQTLMSIVGALLDLYHLDDEDDPVGGLDRAQGAARRCTGLGGSGDRAPQAAATASLGWN